MDDLRAGFEIAEGNMFRHSLITNYRGSHQQEDLFWRAIHRRKERRDQRANV